MACKITTKRQSRIEIEIVRERNFYFYNQYENGNSTIYAQRISPNEAIKTITEFSGQVVAQTGDVRFDVGPHQFSWAAEYWQVVYNDSLAVAHHSSQSLSNPITL